MQLTTCKMRISEENEQFCWVTLYSRIQNFARSFSSAHFFLVICFPLCSLYCFSFSTRPMILRWQLERGAFGFLILGHDPVWHIRLLALRPTEQSHACILDESLSWTFIGPLDTVAGESMLENQMKILWSVFVVSVHSISGWKSWEKNPFFPLGETNSQKHAREK